MGQFLQFFFGSDRFISFNLKVCSYKKWTLKSKGQHLLSKGVSIPNFLKAYGSWEQNFSPSLFLLNHLFFDILLLNTPNFIIEGFLVQMSKVKACKT